MEEISNPKHLSVNKSSNASDVNDHNHVGSNFPFLDGSLFTATIWAGEEGFHATVNGRHETSFAYREVRYDDFKLSAPTFGMFLDWINQFIPYVALLLQTL